MKQRIYVTRRDIEMGVPNDACACPIALAVKRKLGLRGPMDVRVWDYKIAVSKPERDFELSSEMSEFIEAFDEEGWSVKPCAFELVGY